jgi:hypothetical protein
MAPFLEVRWLSEEEETEEEAESKEEEEKKPKGPRTPLEISEAIDEALLKVCQEFCHREMHADCPEWCWAFAVNQSVEFQKRMGNLGLVLGYLGYIGSERFRREVERRLKSPPQPVPQVEETKPQQARPRGKPYFLTCEHCGQWLLCIPGGIEGTDMKAYQEMERMAKMAHKCPKAPPQVEGGKRVEP